MSVLIGGEAGTPDDLLIRNTAYNYSHPVFIDDGAAISVTVPTANTSNPRIDVIVIYVDYGLTPVDTFPNNNNGVIKAKLVQGVAAAVPNKPTNSDILTAIGASNYYTELATYLLPANATTVSDSMITDTRVLTQPVLRSKQITPTFTADMDSVNISTAGKTVAPKMQAGWSFGTATGTNNIATTVTFPVPYSAPPIVTASPIGYGGTAANPTSPTTVNATGGWSNVYNVTATGFTYRYQETGNIPSGGRQLFNWIAIGPS